MDGIRVGYIRISDDIFPSICIGCDVHINYRRKGYAYKAYINLIKMLKDKKYKYLWLEVFEDNKIAIELYKKLGFKIICYRNFRSKKYLRMELNEI